jgi:hypothetical protein
MTGVGQHRAAMQLKVYDGTRLLSKKNTRAAVSPIVTAYVAAPSEERGCK